MKLSLWYDEDGEKLEIGDWVLVNSEFLSVIEEDRDGDRYIKGISDDVIVESVVKSSSA